MISQDAEKVINKVMDKIKEKNLKVKSVIVFGSAVRKGHFKPGTSDVDVVLIVDRLEDVSVENFKDVDGSLELGVLTSGQFLEMYFNGDPLAHMIWLEGQAVYDDGFFEQIKFKSRPKVTELTIMKLRYWGFKNLVNALRAKDPKDHLRSLHHAVRNFARLKVAREKALLAITDEELLELLDRSLSVKYRRFLDKVAGHEGYSEQLVREAIELIEQLDGKSHCNFLA
ncbi:MAG: nucleotidyltransferase domain-containing protein [Candidatus Nezhaarchaeales archaeon]